MWLKMNLTLFWLLENEGSNNDLPVQLPVCGHFVLLVIGEFSFAGDFDVINMQ